MTDKTQIRNAATLILLRREGDQTRILMGQRGRGAAFMPSKFVFPGGALDAGDHALAAEFSASAEDRDALVRSSARNVEPSALALAAIRETWEETGLLLGAPDPRAKDLAAKAPAEWRGFFEKGLIPATEHLRFIFRAVTPPGRPRRFDARFFIAESTLIHGDADKLTESDGELAHLSWLTLAEARQLDLPFITEVVLAEVEARIKPGGEARGRPFFHHEDERSFLDFL